MAKRAKSGVKDCEIGMRRLERDRTGEGDATRIAGYTRYATDMRQSKCLVASCWGWANRRCICKYVRYCSLGCAKHDWQRHRATCMTLRGLTCDAFTGMLKFSAKHVTPFAFYTFMKAIDPILRKIFMIHNILRMTGEADSAVSAKSEMQLYAKMLRCSIESLTRMQPDETATQRAVTAKLMCANTIQTHSKWVKVTQGIIVERVLCFLVDPSTKPMSGPITEVLARKSEDLCRSSSSSNGSI